MLLDRSEEKNKQLLEERWICFYDVKEAIEDWKVIDIVSHHNKDKFGHQKIIHIEIDNYIYSVPYVLKEDEKTFFLKTIYPNRVATKTYLWH